MENVIHIRRYKFLQKLLRVTSWVNRLITNSKGKLLNNEILLNSFITIYNQWQNIKGILKNVFNIPPLPLYDVANP